MIEQMANILEAMPTDTALWVVTCVFIALDVIAGTTKAFLTKTISSEKARKGIMHKSGFLLSMLMCTFIDIGQQIIDFGFSVPVLGMCCVMIITAEIFSLCEHIKSLNPDIKLDFIHNPKDGE